MQSKSLIKFVSITAAFIVLIGGFIYFSEQSLLSSGMANAETVAQSLQDGDTQSVKDQLAEFVGSDNPGFSAEYEQALSSIDYVAETLPQGEDLIFVGGELNETDENTIYGAAFSLPAPQGGEDYLLITMRREDDAWRLANTQLSATNPFESEDEN